MSSNQDNPYASPVEKGSAVERGSAPSTELASRLLRLGAALIDGCIGIAISLPVMIFTGYVERAMRQQVGAVEIVLYSLGGLGAYLLLHGYLLATQGQSIGKMVLGIRIVDYNTGQILPLAKLLGLRLLPVVIVSMIPCVGALSIVDVLFIFGSEKRCVHDLIANTKVVRA